MTDQTPPQTPPAAEPGQPSEEELRAAYEAELNRITSSEMILQTAVSLLNLGGHRLGLAGGEQDAQRDLEQVRDAIDGVRALMPILERRMPTDIRPLRDALAQLQMAFAREAQPGVGSEQAGGQPQAHGQGPGQRAGQRTGEAPRQAPGEAAQAEEEQGPGPAQTSGRLWVPGR